MSQFGRIVKFNKMFLIFFVLFLGLISSNVNEINSREILCGYVHDDPGKLVRMELCPLGNDQYVYLWCIPDIYRNRYMKLINPKWGSKGGHTCVLWCEDVEFLSSCDDCGGGGDLELEIWTKEGCGSTYKDGDRLTIYYKASRDCYAVLYEILPDGREQTLDEGWLQGDQVYSDSGTLKGEGKRIFIITAEGKEARCTISVGREEKTGSLKVYVKDDSGNKLSGASVYVDGDYEGKTNSSGYLSISDVPEGYHTVKASKSGYEDDSERVNVKAGKTEIVYLTLDEKKKKGDAPKIEVIWHVSEKYEIGRGGDLYFTVHNKGGDAKGKDKLTVGGYHLTSGDFNLQKGESRESGWKGDFKVQEKYVKNGYVEIIFYVEMWNDYGRDTYEETRKIPVKEEEKTGSLKVYVKDDSGNKLSGASVFVDGDYEGKTDSSGYLSISDVSEGYHTVKASKSGYKDDSERVNVKAGKTEIVYLTLDEEENIWNDLKKEESYYLRKNSTYEEYVYYNDEIAKMYAPIFYTEKDAKPEPTFQMYRILKLKEGGYLIQYVQVYPIQVSKITFHTIDYSIVHIYFDKNCKIEKIIIGGGTLWMHPDIKKSWEEIEENYPHAIEDDTHLKIIIKDSYHRMELPTKTIVAKSIEVRPLRDQQLGYYYGYPNIGKNNKYMNSMGWDITDPNSAVDKVIDDLPVNLTVERNGSKLTITVKAESESRVTIYITDKKNEEKFTIYGVYYMKDGYKIDQGIPISSGSLKIEINLDYDTYEWIDFPEKFIDSISFNLNGYRVWAVVHKITDKGIRRGQRYSSDISSSSSIYFRNVFSSSNQINLISSNFPLLSLLLSVEQESHKFRTLCKILYIYKL